MLCIEKEVPRPQRKHLRQGPMWAGPGIGKPEAARSDGMAECGSATSSAGLGPGWELSLGPDGMRVFKEKPGMHIFILPQLPSVVVPAEGP